MVSSLVKISDSMCSQMFTIDLGLDIDSHLDAESVTFSMLLLSLLLPEPGPTPAATASLGLLHQLPDSCQPATAWAPVLQLQPGPIILLLIFTK